MQNIHQKNLEADPSTNSECNEQNQNIGRIRLGLKFIGRRGPQPVYAISQASVK